MLLTYYAFVLLRIQNMKIIDGKPEYKGALVSFACYLSLFSWMPLCELMHHAINISILVSVVTADLNYSVQVIQL